MRSEKMFINGQWVDSVSGETFLDLNPATGAVFAEVPKGTAADADRAMAAAFAARKEWANWPAGKRAAILYRAAEQMKANRREFVDLLALEGGASFSKAMGETIYTADVFRTAGEECPRITGETIPSDFNKLSLTLYRPKGVVVAISPWNFPLLLSARKVAYALAAGNTVVLKPSSETPVITLQLSRLFESLGLPPGVLNVITGPGSVVGNALVEDDRAACITFTGDTATGRTVAQKAAAKLKKCTLELGGKDPLIILADADIDYAVNAAAFGAFMHQGQVCISVERIIIEAPLVDEFSRRLAAKAETLAVGDPAKAETIIGPLINDAQVQKVHAQVLDAMAAGATLLTGGTFKGRFYKPTVLTDVTQKMRIFREETFGPVAPIITVHDEHEALAVANNTTYGLSAGIITNDLQKGLFLAENLESGMVHINDSSIHDEPVCPFGGCKESGLGREGGRHSMEEMSELKWVTIQRGKRKFPF
ncbi:MAG: aldehyde dehydrogenase family protein [Deltaproteobacteria bacterium]|nr:aldehyde dehydrogenase family protein [Deltaproteobacteria bacterium]